MKKLLAFICATSMFVASVSSVPVLAEEDVVCDKTIVEEPIVTATYLISNRKGTLL